MTNLKRNEVSALRPCDSCGGKIFPIFYVIRTSTAMIDANAVNRFLGMTQFFGGNGALASVFSSGDEAIKILGDEDPNLMNEFFICQDCMMNDFSKIFMLIEKQDDEVSNAG